MSSHLLLVSLGPVQDFIAAARRCQDLWFGSFLLSELSRAAAIGIEQADPEARLLFPGSLRNEKVAVANKILALLSDEQKPSAVAARAERAMKARLRELRDAAFGKLTAQAHPFFEAGRAEKQLDDLMELQWAAVPIADEQDSYADAHQQVEQLLAWRKNTRRFGRVPWHDQDNSAANFGIPKSSLDGQRESVIREELFERFKDEDVIYRLFYLRSSERLCGVGLLKRIGEETDAFEGQRRPVFHSSSHVAAGPVRARIRALGEDGRQALRTYHDSLSQLSLRLDRFRAGPNERDGVLLFASRLQESFEVGSDHAALDPKIRQQTIAKAVEKARQSLRYLFGQIGLSGAEPLPYYAMIAADGDRMGDAIRRLAVTDGEVLSPALQDLQPAARHQFLSQRLSAFAHQSACTVAVHEGSLIYSGGDDVLALVPLHRALDCARALRDDFEGAMTGLFAPAISPPTLSVGIGIAHHLDLMEEMRSLARDAEHDAKQQRNSLGIRLSPRSGGLLTASGAWSEERSLDTRIKNYVRLLIAEKLPDSIAFDLEEAVRPLLIRTPGSPQESQELAEVAASLVRRVLKRKRQGRGDKDLSPEQIAEIAGYVEADDPLRAISRVSTELQIARHLAHAYLQADPSLGQSAGEPQ